MIEVIVAVDAAGAVVDYETGPWVRAEVFDTDSQERIYLVRDQPEQGEPSG